MAKELEQLLRMIEGRITRALIDRDGTAFGHWSHQKKWVKSKIRIYGATAKDVIKAELDLLLDEYARVVPSQHERITEHRQMASGSVTEMMKLLS